MPDITFDFNQLFEAVRAEANDEDAYTMAELMDLTGMGKTRLRREIKAMIQAGLCKPARKHADFIDGRRVPVAAYSFSMPQ